VKGIFVKLLSQGNFMLGTVGVAEVAPKACEGIRELDSGIAMAPARNIMVMNVSTSFDLIKPFIMFLLTT